MMVGETSGEVVQPADSGPSLSQLQSDKSSRRLEQIAGLRARGIGDHVDLPQLVVCGDQSAGKSSVLEGITGLPFPRQDGVCTKFATEIILQHSEGPRSIVAIILPSSSRAEASKSKLEAYKKVLGNFNELPIAIAEVGTLMGIRGFPDVESGPAFAEDVLRIEVSGQTGLYLTVVDLPGLIGVANEEQTDDDVHTVQRLVESYVKSARTIVLAVVQATNDIANQRIIQISRRFDKAGERTVGIITKPDLINVGTEKRIALLAKNEDTTKLRLGFFLVKNPTPSEMELGGIKPEQRQRDETKYFDSPPWKEQALNMDRVGIISLRTYLQSLLDKHIERELPKVRGEIRDLMREKEREMMALGEERPTIGHLRMYLSRLAMQSHNLTKAALDGNYYDADASFFGRSQNETNPARLRALVHRLNTEFSNYMRNNGQKRKVVNARRHRDSETFEDISGEEDLAKGQVVVDEAEMKAWVKEVYNNSRGRELPGNYNHVLLSELFHVQSSRWQQIAQDHLNDVYDRLEYFLKTSLRHITTDERVLAELQEFTEVPLRRSKQYAEKELESLCEDEKHQPITYNHYYTDNVQNARLDSTRKQIEKAMDEVNTEEWHGKMHISNNSVDAPRLLASLQKRVIVDMDAQACTEALANLSAYYKVAMKTFVDNVCKQVIERHLLRRLAWIFCPEQVAAFKDEDLQRIAAEAPENVEIRRHLRELHKKLDSSLQDLRR
ncbi:MAG: hypothetical protein M1828_002341 [Chrysothrix sp. TS-e1954]|nr:MAG: hypothetical protein M1828_002341 [Chrysothrix sp. TS-e1954]